MKDKPVFWQQWPALLAIVAFAAVILIGSFLLDAPIQRWVVDHQASGAKTFMKWVSRLGDWDGHVLTALVGMGFAWRRGSKDWMRICLALIVACAVGGAAARVGKIGLGRARPSAHAAEQWNGPRLTSRYHSFPSGHVTSSMAFFTPLLLLRRKVGAALLWIPALIGASRVYLLAHYFSDVVGGVLIGVACGYMVVRMLLCRMDSGLTARI